MDYTFVLRLTPKPQRIQKRNTSPEEWKKICEEREILLMEKKNKEQEAPEINNDLAISADSGYAEDRDDWEDIEKWELENNEKSSLKKSHALKKSSGPVPRSSQGQTSSGNIVGRPADEKINNITDRLDTLTID